MSVKVADRKQGDLAIITKAKALAVHTLRCVQNEKIFPKRHRFTVSNRLVDMSLEILDLICEANDLYPTTAAELEERLLMQRKAMAKCRAMIIMLGVAWELFSLPAAKVAHWSGLVSEIRAMARSWHDTDLKRFRYLYGDSPDTPNSGNANNARNVNSDGSRNNNNAYNGNNGLRPDCVISRTE